ncbi:MAG: hypothetical protein K2P80_03925 [Beijerinckiaceae bacterium]|nr:hypothetical protein [Beijerinckiaceae bacterium]
MPRNCSIHPQTLETLRKLREDLASDEALEREIDELLSEFDGSARDVIRALLHDLDAIIADRDASVSAGYVRRSRGRAP